MPIEQDYDPNAWEGTYFDPDSSIPIMRALDGTEWTYGGSPSFTPWSSPLQIPPFEK